MRTRKKQVALTPEEVARGIAECTEWAHDLYMSGLMLNHQGMVPSAGALLIIALEEYGKIGWLYRALMLAPDAEEEWRGWWDKFKLHTLKNEVARMMMVRGGLLPMLTPFFRDRFPLFAVTPDALDRHKQAMLYADFDEGKRAWVSPRKYVEARGIENGALVEDVEQVVRYVARNNQAGVFDTRVVMAYHRLNELAPDEPDRFTLLRLFYAAILRAPTGQVQEKPLDEVVTEVRYRHPEEADQLVRDWTDLGQALHESAP